MLISSVVNGQKAVEERVDARAVSIVEGGMIMLEDGMSFVSARIRSLAR